MSMTTSDVAGMPRFLLDGVLELAFDHERMVGTSPGTAAGSGSPMPQGAP